jgi:hypothetical protein
MHDYTRNTQYPWDRWFDGKVHWLKRGVHFTTTPDHFLRSAKLFAESWDLSIEAGSRGKYVHIRTFPKVR